ncbi:dihydroxyacetone kinase subunit DhaL [Geodermatophilus sp. YIM 151500]|uniref:dihydroxyacetone kinase subunit DhaL n=1 Tax=Geodermatophilus sp. YIM 151500 TaxID=2984531 RepID=UPI0021E366A6|nr:dihydroxyacetone kinase subunit DhaL [Geodermatophilus sp. YIM 151500]MCV2489337.1 dihydroxyacetone kinase subunit DhaL [Geodermatophilus sp. YIM 151500]
MADAVDAAGLTAWVQEFARLVREQRDVLTELDAAIGDADHGANLDRGLTAVVSALDADPAADPAAVLKTVATTLIRTVGGASGPLYGTFFLRASGTLGGGDGAALAAALRAGLDGVAARGKAGPGDKTMLDALAPACDALDEALADGRPLDEALRAAAEAAAGGRDATVPMVARKGRASYLGERSAGHQDPGATSAALMLQAAATALTGRG